VLVVDVEGLERTQRIMGIVGDSAARAAGRLQSTFTKSPKSNALLNAVGQLRGCVAWWYVPPSSVLQGFFCFGVGGHVIAQFIGLDKGIVRLYKDTIPVCCHPLFLQVAPE
jgi:hypothetical protein